jgi:hypothetical protein
MSPPRATSLVLATALILVGLSGSLTAPDAAPASPAATLTGIADSYDVELDATTAAQVQALEGLPADHAEALADVLAAFEAMRTAEDDIEQRQRSLTVAARTLAATWQDPELPDPLTDPIEIGDVAVLDLAGRATTYTVNRALIVDVGGSDTYRNNAGGANRNHEPVAAVVDLAGDDGYGSHWSGPDFGDNGGGIFGVGFLYDAAGDDEYRGGATLASNGGAFFGHGRLVDDAGDDLYLSARTWCDVCVNGGAWLSSGLLWDRGGTDTYGTHAYYGGSLSQDETVDPKGSRGSQLDSDEDPGWWPPATSP